MTLEQIFKLIEERKEQAVKDLTEFVKIPSVSAKEQSLPEAAGYAASLMKKYGFETKIHETGGGPVATGWLDVGAKRTLLFYDHADVQPAEPFELWHSPPFELTIREGKMFGRGVGDNKGEFVGRINAIRAWLDSGEKLPCNIKFVVETEEENSSKNLGTYMKNDSEFLQNVDGCIWEFGGSNEEGLQQFILGVKGILYVQLSISTLGRDAHSAYAPFLPNAGERLMRAIHSLKDDQNKILIPNFYDDIVGVSKEEQEVIKDYTFNEKEIQKNYGLEQFLKGLTGEKLKQAYFTEPTCNLCGFGTGWQGEGGKTIIPKEATAKIDFRLVMNQDPEKILSLLRKHLDDNGFQDVKVDWWKGYPPAKTSPSHEFVQLCKRANVRVYNHEPVIQSTSGGSGPMYLFINLMPCVSLGSGHAGTNAHSPNENIIIEDFLKGMKCIAALIEEFKNW